MSQDRRVSFVLADAVLAELVLAAGAAGCAPADLVRSAVVASLGRRVRPDWRTAVPGDLSQVASGAAGWVDLQSRLRRMGFVLRACGATGWRGECGIDLHSWPSDRRLMEAGAAGLSLHALTLRFRAPFPGFVGRNAATGSGPGTAATPAAATRVIDRAEVDTGREGAVADQRAAAGAAPTGRPPARDVIWRETPTDARRAA